MDENEPWEKQKRMKYEHHDFSILDFSNRDSDAVKERAIYEFVNSKEGDSTKLIVESFMSFLTKKGYRITKVST